MMEVPRTTTRCARVRWSVGSAATADTVSCFRSRLSTRAPEVRCAAWRRFNRQSARSASRVSRTFRAHDARHAATCAAAACRSAGYAGRRPGVHRAAASSHAQPLSATVLQKASPPPSAIQQSSSVLSVSTTSIVVCAAARGVVQ